MEPTELVDRIVESFNTRNAPIFTNLFVDDAEFVTILGNRMQGKEAISAGHQMVFETLLAGTHIKATGSDSENTPTRGARTRVRRAWSQSSQQKSGPDRISWVESKQVFSGFVRHPFYFGNDLVSNLTT